jgi:hypothetical protein
MGETQELGDTVQEAYFPGFVYQGVAQQATTKGDDSYMGSLPGITKDNEPSLYQNPLAYAFGLEHMLPHQQPSAEGAMKYEAVDAWKIEKIKREQERRRRREQGQRRIGVRIEKPPQQSIYDGDHLPTEIVPNNWDPRSQPRGIEYL